MIITETGILVSTDPNMKEPAPLNFKIEGGQVGDNSVRATGLTGNTTYYAQSYFVKDGIYVRQKGVTEFKTAAQAEVLKIKNAYAGSNTIYLYNYYCNNKIELDYSTDQGTTWTHWVSGGTNLSATLPANGELWLKGNNNRISTSSGSYYNFNSTQQFDCEGSLSALMSNDLSVLPDYCFERLFYNSKVRVAPELANNITLGLYCYQRTFEGCSYLTQAPSLPATVLADYCYDSLFMNCSSLVNAPSLPATVMARACYKQLFYGCTSIVQAPDLPATSLAAQCYDSLFMNCSSLVNAPSLPATVLADYCYQGLFKNCTALTQSPSLPATSLATGCYSMMFQGCTALTQSPDLPATSISGVGYCYQSMFYGCTSLNRIVCYSTNWNTTNAGYWVNRVAPTGDFYNLGGATIPIDSVNGVPIGWTLHTSLHDPLTITNVESGQNTITLTKNGSPQDITLEYSTDNGSTWTSWSSANGNLSVSIGTGQSVQLRGNNTNFSSERPDFYQFGSTGKFTLSGSAMSVFDDSVNRVPGNAFWSAFESTQVTSISSDFIPATQISNACYRAMFKGCTSLEQAPNLPATTIGESCYYEMFKGCTDLISIPTELPATTLANHCYQSMFEGCASITQAPTLPSTATTNQCYYSMFKGCTSLTQAPTLPATICYPYCYYSMFNGCTALTQAPALPATTLSSSCYQGMFEGCTSLTQATATLPATTLASGCYSSMFQGCTSLTQAPNLPSKYTSYTCYYQMFKGCSSLNKIYVSIRNWDTAATRDWVDGVASNGDFYNLEGASIPTGTSGIPQYWTEHTSL